MNFVFSASARDPVNGAPPNVRDGKPERLNTTE